MSKQVDVLIRGKQQTQGTLHSLKRQVDALDDLVSSTSSDSLFLADSSSSLLSLRDALSLTKTQAALTGHAHFPSSSAGVPAVAHTWHSCSWEMSQYTVGDSSWSACAFVLPETVPSSSTPEAFYLTVLQAFAEKVFTSNNKQLCTVKFLYD